MSLSRFKRSSLLDKQEASVVRDKAEKRDEKVKKVEKKSSRKVSKRKSK